MAELELEPGEDLRASTHASFRGAAAASARATFALGSARVRNRAYEAWRDVVEAAGFPTAGPEMILGVTNRRLLACSPTFWMGRPAEIRGHVALERIAEVAVVRHGLVVGLSLALTNGRIVEVEAMRGRRLHAFADALREQIAHA